MNINFYGIIYNLEFGRYPIGGALYIRLINEKDEEDDLIASVNLPGKLQGAQVAIKDYSENEGMLDLLITAGIVTEPLFYVHSGYVDIPVCELIVCNKCFKNSSDVYMINLDTYQGPLTADCPKIRVCEKCQDTAAANNENVVITPLW